MWAQAKQQSDKDAVSALSRVSARLDVLEAAAAAAATTGADRRSSMAGEEE
eukprot:SAG25_NODE_2474_length_1583_cov_1.280323_1_plen_51_part_00